jgi:hypothetical protein
MNSHLGPQKNTTSDTSIRIVAKTKKQLSREAKKFNTLTARISRLEREIQHESEKLDQLFTVYARDVQPLEHAHAVVMMDVAALLSIFPEKKKLGRKQRESVREMILDLCERSFCIIEPSAEQKAVYDKWSDIRYEDEYKRQSDGSKAEIAQMLKDEMGLDVDLSDIDDSPEGFARFKEKIEAELGKQWDERPEVRKGKKRSRADERVRTEEFMRVQEREKAEEELKTKSIRSIYIALAKVLHPDTEIDPDLKNEKEETMKRVTLAYAERDFTALLRLEMEWVHKESLRADRLTDEKLKIYCSALEDQVAELKLELAMLPQHPRYLPVAHLADLPEWRALDQLRDEARNEKLAIAEFTRFKHLLESPASYKEILADIEGYLDAFVSDEPTLDDIEAFLKIVNRLEK